MSDEKACSACPLEVRGLYAVAFNLLNLRSDPDRWQRKIGERLDELQDAVVKMTPIIEAHFADDDHARHFGHMKATKVEP